MIHMFMKMKVILLQDVKPHGKKGDVVEINDGYARNYILPKKLGVEANAANASWPKASAGYTRTWLPSTRYVEDGSYMKLKYVTLSYDWLRPIPWIEKIRFSLTANNVFTITNYSWFDPDVNAGGSNASCPGVDSYSYPSARSFTFGLNFVF